MEDLKFTSVFLGILDVRKIMGSSLKDGVAEPHHFSAGPAPNKNFD
jgi:hypothetical protein